MFSPFKFPVSFRPSAGRTVHQVISRRGFTVVNHRLADPAVPAPVPQSIEDKWYKRLQDQLEVQQQNQQQQLDKLLSFQKQQSDKHDAQRMELFKTIVKQAKRNTALASIAVKERTQRLKVQQNFNLLGALEMMVSHAIALGKLKTYCRTQVGLNRLSRLPEYKALFRSEVAARRLAPDQVKGCVSGLYHTVSKHAHGNDRVVILKASDYAVNELTALVVFFKLQSTWPDALKWLVEAEDDMHVIVQDNMKEIVEIERMGDRMGVKEAGVGMEIEEVTMWDEINETKETRILQAMEEEANQAEEAGVAGTKVDDQKRTVDGAVAGSSRKC